MRNAGKRRIVFPTNTTNIKDYYDRMEYIANTFETNPFTLNELVEKFSRNPQFGIKADTMKNAANSLCALGLLTRVDTNQYKVSRYGRIFLRGSLEEDSDFYNDFIMKINQNYTCYVRDKIEKPYELFTKTFQNLNGKVYKYELFPLFFVDSDEEYENYIETIKRSRNEHNIQIIVNYVQNLLDDGKINLDDIDKVVNRDVTSPTHLFTTLGFIKKEVCPKGQMLELPGNLSINLETFYRFSEEGFDKYFTEEETVEIYVDEMEEIAENVDETTLSINTTVPPARVSSNTSKTDRSKKVQAYVIKRDKYNDFFKDIESEYGHPRPRTLNGKPKVIVHHTVPLKYQKLFKDKNLDVTYLCVCVCIVCHDILHSDNISQSELELKTRLVKHMYDNKKDYLSDYLNINTYEEFAKLYNL